MPEALPGDATSSAIDAEHLVRDNIGWMLVLAERLLGERGLAEDVVQESLVRALEGLAGFQGRSSLKSWLHRITVNMAITKLRQLKRLAEQPMDEYMPEFDAYDCRIELPWSRLATVEEVLESDYARRHVQEAMVKLPDAYRVVIQLRDLEEYDTNEVAALLDISEGNVKVRLHRARAALKKLLEPLLRGEVPKR